MFDDVEEEDERFSTYKLLVILAMLAGVHMLHFVVSGPDSFDEKMAIENSAKLCIMQYGLSR